MHLPIPRHVLKAGHRRGLVVAMSVAALGTALAVVPVAAPSASAGTGASAFEAAANSYQNAQIASALAGAPDGVRVGADQVEWNNYSVVLTVPATANASVAPAATDTCPAPIVGFRWTCLYGQAHFVGRRLQFKDAGFFQDIEHYGGVRWITLSWSNTRGQRTWLQQNASHQNHGYELCLTGNAHAGLVNQPYLNARWIYLSDNYDHC
jgi:hypothetical protein